MAIGALIDAIERDAGKTDAHSQAKLARNLFLLRAQTAALQTNVKAATTGGGVVTIIPPKPSTGELLWSDIDAAVAKFEADPDFKQSDTQEARMALAQKLGIVREMTASGMFGDPDDNVEGADYSDYDAASNGGSNGPDGTGRYEIWKDGILVDSGQLEAGEDLTDVAKAAGLDMSGVW